MYVCMYVCRVSASLKSNDIEALVPLPIDHLMGKAVFAMNFMEGFKVVVVVVVMVVVVIKRY